MPLCPICDNNIGYIRYLKTYIFDFYNERFKQGYRLYHCPNCHLEFLVDRAGIAISSFSRENVLAFSRFPIDKLADRPISLFVEAIDSFFN